MRSSSRPVLRRVLCRLVVLVYVSSRHGWSSFVRLLSGVAPSSPFRYVYMLFVGV